MWGCLALHSASSLHSCPVLLVLQVGMPDAPEQESHQLAPAEPSDGDAASSASADDDFVLVEA